jgi:FKBP-type peptidyl-prolyl cis-trans isomerase
MRFTFATLLLLLTLVAIGCGSGDDVESSRSQGTRPASAADRAKPKTYSSSHRPVGTFKQEGPFSAISGGSGNDRPSFDPPDRLPPKRLLFRELEVGSGPPAQRGDEVGVFYVGAIYKTGNLRYGGWPPAHPATFQLGFSFFGESWEESIEGMRVGGLREVIIPSRRLEGSTPPALNYVIELVTLKPASENS